MTNFDKMFDWFRNTNTMPGPGAGHSIDPSKPGPDDAEPNYDRAEATRADAEMVDALASLSQSGGRPQSDAQKELNDIAVAIGSNRFLDPPDGGSVSLAEQVTRMRQALEKAEAAQSDAEPAPFSFSPQAYQAIEDALAQSNAEPVSAREDYEASCGLGFKMPSLRPDASAGQGHSLIKGERSGISWGGFYVEGDRKSIYAVRDAFNAKERCEALDRMISEKQLVRPSASAGLNKLAIAQAIVGPCNLELRAQKWAMISEGERKERLWQAQAVIDLIKTSPDASADRKALQSLHWHLLNRTENREVLLGIVEDALGFRARTADRSRE
jgi:hypothetical protein